MAQYVKNNINFHGARSRTSVAENSNSRHQGPVQTRNQNEVATNASSDGFWGSTDDNLPQNADYDNWGDVPDDSSAQDGAWGQDRIVSGMSRRNQRFRSNKNTTTIHVSGQLPHWGDANTEFPALGSNPAPVENVWEKRKEKFQEIRSLAPSSQTEEERMIRKALELSKMDARREEERKRALEEEYQLQMQLLKSNPELFQEFLIAEDYGGAASSNAKKIELKDNSDYYSKDGHCNNSNSKGDSIWGAESSGKREKSNNKKTKKQANSQKSVALASETTRKSTAESVFEEDYLIQNQKLETNPELYKDFIVREEFVAAASNDAGDTWDGYYPEQDHKKERHGGGDEFWDVKLPKEQQEVWERTNNKKSKNQTNNQSSMNSRSEILKNNPAEFPSAVTKKSSIRAASEATSMKQTSETVEESFNELASETTVKSCTKLPSEIAQKQPQKANQPNIPKVVQMFGGWGTKTNSNANTSSRAFDSKTSVDLVMETDPDSSNSKVQSNETKGFTSAFSKSTSVEKSGLKEAVQPPFGTDCTEVSSKSKKDVSTGKYKSVERPREEIDLTDKPRQTLADKESKPPKVQNTIPINKKEYGVPSKPFCVISHSEGKKDEISAPQYATSHIPKDLDLPLIYNQKAVAQNQKSEIGPNIPSSASLQTQINSEGGDARRAYPPGIDCNLKTIVSDYADLALKCKETSDNDKTANMKVLGDDPTILNCKSKNSLFSILATDAGGLNEQKTLLDQIETTFVNDQHAANDSSITYSLSNTPKIYSENNALLNVDLSTDLQRTDASASVIDSREQSLSFGGFAADGETSMNDDTFGHIEPPQAAPLPMPSPGFSNPPYMDPRMTGFMNPYFMRGMDPSFLMQEMMMRPYFMQQVSRMQMYYASLGMSHMAGLPSFCPQPIPTPQFTHDANQQILASMVGQAGIAPTSELSIDVNPSMPPPFQGLDGNSNPSISPPRFDPGLIQPEVAPKAPQYNDESWLNGFISDGLQYGDQSTFIPPPKMESTSTAVSSTPESDHLNKSAFIPSSAEYVGHNIVDPTAEISRDVTRSKEPKSRVCYTSVQTPSLVTANGAKNLGWGSLDNSPVSEKYISKWDDAVDGWGSDESTATRSMRNSARYVSANTATRQPASQPQVRHCRISHRGK